MTMIEWARSEIERAKLLEYTPIDKIKEKIYKKFEKLNPNVIDEKLINSEIEAERILNEYVELIYNSVLELFETFSRQDHSGMSAKLVEHQFHKLVHNVPLTPITGEDDEWEFAYEEDKEIVYQSKRMFSLFKHVNSDSNMISYSYTKILDVLNIDDVWEKYPPENDSGTLDDDHPLVIKYLNSLRTLKKSLNDQITFPFTPVTYKYVWDFESQTFKERKT